MSNKVSEAKAYLIELRTREEMKLAAFAKSIAEVDREVVFKGVYIPPDLTLKALCPEAYKENPNPEVYQQQFAEMKRIFDAINNRINEYTQEAIECYNAYLTSRS